MTQHPSRNTTISLITLTVVGVAAIIALAINAETWIAHSAAAKRIAETCSGFGSGCSDALTSMARVLGSPEQLLLSVAITALVVAGIRALFILVAARRMAARFTLPGESIPRLRAVLAELGAEGVRVRVVDDSGVAAFTHGVIKPTVCISKGLVDTLGDAELTALVAHEIGHVRRRDNLAIFIALFVRNFMWPLPVIHHLFAIFIQEKEYAADDYAVRLTERPLDLASAIVSVAKATRSTRALSPAYATFFPGKVTAKARVDRLLGVGERAAPSLGRLLASIAISVIMVMAVVGLAYAQTPVSGTVVDTCGMGKACVEQNYACCE